MTGLKVSSSTRRLVSSSSADTKWDGVKVSTSYQQWFAGFVDAEGNFLISPGSRNHVNFRFRIRLHIDDLATLEKIRSTLDVGVVKIEGNSCIYIVSGYDDLRYVILPIFNQFPLLTVKALDLKDFIAALEIKGQYLGSRLPELSYNKIIEIKNGMNTGRKNIDENQLSSIVSNVNISSYWLLGFVEGDGTFGIKNLVPYFQIAQHNRSVSVMVIIKQYFANLPRGKIETKSTPTPNLAMVTNKRTNVHSLSITNIDVLYDYIVPWFQVLNFNTRKEFDFKLWAVAVTIHKHGYFYLPTGRSLLLSIVNSINTKRYSTNNNGPVTSPSDK